MDGWTGGQDFPWVEQAFWVKCTFDAQHEVLFRAGFIKGGLVSAQLAQAMLGTDGAPAGHHSVMHDAAQAVFVLIDKGLEALMALSA
jgi:hypothetical protein